MTARRTANCTPTIQKNCCDIFMIERDETQIHGLEATTHLLVQRIDAAVDLLVQRVDSACKLGKAAGMFFHSAF